MLKAYFIIFTDKLIDKGQNDLSGNTKSVS
jgi:hypothetical protein